MIWVDYREKELIALLGTMVEEKCLQITNLPLGDIVLSNHSSSPEMAIESPSSSQSPSAVAVAPVLTNESIWTIFERKTISDMAASIRDGRYEEQAFRLRDSPIHNHNVVYLVEGNPSKLLARSNRFSKNHISTDTMYSAFCSILFLKGFSLYHAMDLHDSASFIVQCHRKLTKELSNPSKRTSKSTKASKYTELYYTNNMTNGDMMSCRNHDENKNINKNDNDKKANDVLLLENEENQLNEMKTSKTREYESIMKKKNVYTSDRGVHMAMLAQIPSVSAVIAGALLDEFDTPMKLASRIRENPALLTEWKYGANTNASQWQPSTNTIAIEKDTNIDIVTSQTKGKGRRLSKTCRENIEKFLTS